MTAASSSSGFVPKTDSNFSSASSYLAFLQPIFRKIVHIVLPYSALDKFQSQKQHCRCSTFWFGHISPYIQILWIKHTVHCFTFELQIYKMTSHNVLKLYSRRWFFTGILMQHQNLHSYVQPWLNKSLSG
jgi:hypothetical protein